MDRNALSRDAVRRHQTTLAWGNLQTMTNVKIKRDVMRTLCGFSQHDSPFVKCLPALILNMLCNLTLHDLRILKITFDFESSFLNLCLLWMPIGNCKLKRRRPYLYVALYVLRPLTQRAIKLFLLLTFARPLSSFYRWLF